jgi:bifunctional non-homologous end joining protein LigD
MQVPFKCAGSTLRAKSFPIDGEAVCCGENDIPEFKLQRQKRMSLPLIFSRSNANRNTERAWCARPSWRKFLGGAPNGLQISKHIDIDGATMFEHACRLGLEGIVSKRLGWRYESGRSALWLKTKNPNAPTMRRVLEEDWNGRIWRTGRRARR